MWAPKCRNSALKHRAISRKIWCVELRKVYNKAGFLISFATLRSGVCCPLKSLSTWSGLRLASGRFRVIVSTLTCSFLASSWSDLTLPLVKSWYHFQLRATHKTTALRCNVLHHYTAKFIIISITKDTSKTDKLTRKNAAPLFRSSSNFALHSDLELSCLKTS